MQVLRDPRQRRFFAAKDLHDLFTLGEEYTTVPGPGAPDEPEGGEECTLVGNSPPTTVVNPAAANEPLMSLKEVGSAHGGEHTTAVVGLQLLLSLRE